MTNVLVTGGAGFIGSSLAERLLRSGHYKVVCVDNFLTGDPMKVPNHPLCEFVKCDVNNLEEIQSVFASHQFDFVFHFAAVVGVKRTIENPLLVLRDLDGISNILRLCKSTRVKRVFYSSSSEVYGEPVEIPQHEERTPLNSRLPYAVVKNAGEAFCKSYKKEFGLDYTVFRFFNTYGSKQSKDFVITRFIQAAAQGLPITIYGDGKQSRTFCHIDDNVDCIFTVLDQNLCVNEVINVGNDKEYTILELAEAIIKITGSSSPIKFLPPLEEGDMSRRRPDNSRMRAILGRELISLDDGIRRIVPHLANT